jgi:signal transduction histidine kinase
MWASWARLSLATQFAVAGALVLIVGMGAIGAWVAKRIEDGVVSNTAAATATYMDSVLAPLLQNLANAPTLTPEAIAGIDRLLDQTEIGRRIHAFKVWKEGGFVAYSTRPQLIGRTFPPTANLVHAWRGEVSGDLDDLRDEEDALERGAGISLLEIYAPIRQSGTGRIIAVAEFYARATELTADLARARRDSWLVVGSATLAMMVALAGIVGRGSRTIDDQRARLETQVQQLSALLESNKQLQLRVERAYRSTASTNERFLRRVGADLHDGPAQLVGLALLRLDGLCDGRGQGETEAVRGALTDALVDLRRISAGLALPELRDASLEEAIDLAIRSHERRTGTAVDRDLRLAGAEAPHDVVVGVYRLVQEGLSNAFRHAAGRGQKISAVSAHGRLDVSVVDEGPGLPAGTPEPSSFTGIGLSALRDRIEALGGFFHIEPNPPNGTRLMAVFTADALERTNG